MLMRQGRRVTTVVVIVVATALSLVTPSAASTASVPSIDDAGDAQVGLRWLYCVNGNTHVIFRRTGNGCTAGLDSVGFAALHKRPGGYRLQVCATQTDQVGMWVDPADANGNSTGNTIYYSDDPYGPCYNRNIGYPVRKFQLVHLWVNGVDFSGWMRAPT
jgi:hypothetical protein